MSVTMNEELEEHVEQKLHSVPDLNLKEVLKEASLNSIEKWQSQVDSFITPERVISALRKATDQGLMEMSFTHREFEAAFLPTSIKILGSPRALD